MFKIGNDQFTVTNFKDIAFSAISNPLSIENVQVRTQSGQRYTRSTGKPIVDYEISFDLDKTEFETIAQYTSPTSIRDYYCEYENGQGVTVFAGVARLVIDDVSINHDSQIYNVTILIEMS